jgi:hypothetical protein
MGRQELQEELKVFKTVRHWKTVVVLFKKNLPSSLNLLSDIHRRIFFLSFGFCDIETSVSVPVPSADFHLKAYVPVFGAELPAIPAVIKSSALMFFLGGILRHIFMPGDLIQ